jgi:hypothetical protein
VLIFSQALVVAEFVFSHFVIFRYKKVAKYIWEPCCQLAAETGKWFPLIKY